MHISDKTAQSADYVPMLSVAVPLLAALRLPGSAHRWVSERTIGSRQMSMPHGVSEERIEY
jgi:hypothetical protein